MLPKIVCKALHTINVCNAWYACGSCGTTSEPLGPGCPNSRFSKGTSDGSIKRRGWRNAAHRHPGAGGQTHQSRPFANARVFRLLIGVGLIGVAGWYIYLYAFNKVSIAGVVNAPLVAVV